MNNRINQTNGRFPSGIRALALITALCGAFVVSSFSGMSPTDSGEYFYQPKHKEYLKILAEHESLLSDIIRRRALLIWGQQSASYLEGFGDASYDGFYQRDSVFIQRRACWRSRLFATDLDFIEVSLYTVDGAHALRETYAINRDDNRWAVIDSAGFPLFERISSVSRDKTDSPEKLAEFLLTLLSYAGYGSYDILGTVDTFYHEIDLADEIDDDFYPFTITTDGDTTNVQFTSCLRGGVEVSRWSISYFPDGIIIDESDQLITYLDLPKKDYELADAEERDTTAIADLLSDVDTLEPGDSATVDSEAVATGAIGGDIRLADLIRGNRPNPQAKGTVSYEIVSYKLAEVLQDTVIETGPEFVIFSEPLYPPAALIKAVSATVEMMVKVDSAGRSRQAMVVNKSGADMGFETTCRRAAALCTFRPGLVGGKPVSMWLTYRVTFSMATTGETAEDAPTSGRARAILEREGGTKAGEAEDTTKRQPDSTTQSDSSTVDSTVTDSVRADSARADTASADTLTDTLADTIADTLADSLSDTLSDTTGTPADTTSGDN